MKIHASYHEPCTCEYQFNDDTQYIKNSVWRFVTIKCPQCERTLATYSVSDSPMTHFYCAKEALIRMNNTLREEKKLPTKRTIITFYDENGKRILWKDIVAENKNWEKKMGYVQRKPL